MEDVAKMRLWSQGDEEDHLAPNQDWYKDFGSFFLVGYGRSVRSVLDKKKIPWGYALTGESPLQANLHQLFPKELPVYHESFVQNLESIRRRGIDGFESGEGDGLEGVFGTIGRPSGFITKKEKIIVKFVIPSSHYRLVSPDMRYTDENSLLRNHPMLVGADVYFSRPVPPIWIENIDKAAHQSKLFLQRRYAGHPLE